MEKFKSKLEEEFYERMSSIFRAREMRGKFRIKYEPDLNEYTSNNISHRPDFLILKGECPFVIVEVTARIDDENKVQR